MCPHLSMLRVYVHVQVYKLGQESFYTCTTPIVLKARHLAKWLCLLLGLGLPDRAGKMERLPLGLG